MSTLIPKRSVLISVIAVLIASISSLLGLTPLALSQNGDPSDPGFVNTLEQLASSVRLESTLAGNLQDFSIEKVRLQANQKQLLAQRAEEYKQLAERDPTNADLHYQFSLILQTLGQNTGARQALQNALRLDPNMKKARNQLGILSISEDRAASETQFRAAMSGESKVLEAKNNLGALFAVEGRFTEAADFLRDATTDQSSYPEAHLNLGYVLMALRDYKNAEGEFRQVLRLRSNSVSALSGFGIVSVKLGRGQEAVEILQRVVRIWPDSAGAHSNLAMALATDGFDLPGALAEFSQAIQLEQSSPFAYYGRGKILNEMKRLEEARSDLEIACRLKPDYPEALYLLAQIERQLGNVQHSADLLKNVVKLQPDNLDAQLSLGRSLVSLGQLEEAVQHLRQAAQLSPNNPDVLYNLGQTLNKMGRSEGKIYLERFQRVKRQIEIDDRVQHLGSYGLEAAAKKDWPEAVKDFQEAIELCGQCASLEDLHRNLGLIYVLKGDVEEGRRELEAALKMKPTDSDARRALESLPTDAPR